MQRERSNKEEEYMEKKHGWTAGDMRVRAPGKVKK